MANRVSFGAQTPLYVNYQSAAYANGKIYYCAGGDRRSYPYPQDYRHTVVDIFNITSNSWSKGPSLLTGTTDPRCIGLGDYIYVIGGRLSNDRPFYSYSNQRINTKTNTVESLQSSTYRVSNYYGIAAVNNEIYILGYYDFPTNESTPDSESLWLQYIQVYNPALNSWRVMGARVAGTWNSFATIGVDDKIYCCGGSDWEHGGVNYFRVLDVTSESWTNLPPCPVSIGHDYTFYNIGNKIFTSVYNSGSGNSYSIIEFDITNNTWNVYDSFSLSNFSIYNGIGVNEKLYFASSDYYDRYYYDRRIAIIDISKSIVNDLHPTEGFIDRSIGNRFSWSLTNGFENTTQRSALFQWRNGSSGSTNQLSINGANQYIDVVGGTFPLTYNLQWRVQATASNGLVSDWSDWITLSTIKETILANPAPISGFINEQEANTFTWTLTDGENPLTQTSAAFQWRNGSNGSVNTINITGSNQYVTVAANIFPNTNNLQWRAQVTSTFGTTSDWSQWFILTTIDEVPLKPTNLYPSSGTRDGTKVITFTWRHNSTLSTPQTAFDLQITYNNGSSWTDLSGKQTTPSQLYNAPANSIVPTDPTGKVGWRVRTYNSDGVVGPWSDAAWFIVEASPDPPTWVSINTGSNFPLCRWISPIQTTYRLQVTSVNDTSNIFYDSGRVFSQDTFHQLKYPVKDGSYLFRVMVTNNRGIGSDWSNFQASIVTTKRMSIVLHGEPRRNYAFLTWEVKG